MNDCGPKKFPLWLRKLITGFVTFNKYCKLHDIEYTIISKKQADSNFIALLKKDGLSSWKLSLIKIALKKLGNKYYEANMIKNVRNSVFAVCNFFTKKEGLIHPIGGKVDANESTVDAFKREFFEETNYKLKDSQFNLEFTNLLAEDSLPDNWYQSFFALRDVKFEDLKASNEVSEIIIVDKYQLMNTDDSLLSFAAQAIKKFYLNDSEIIYRDR